MHKPRKVRELTLLARELRQRQTKAEAILWERLRNKRCNGIKFRRQYVIGPFITDFCSPTQRLVVELYGAAHAGTDAAEYDEVRTSYITACGYTVLTFTNEDVYYRMEHVLTTIISTAPPPTPLSRR